MRQSEAAAKSLWEQAVHSEHVIGADGDACRVCPVGLGVRACQGADVPHAGEKVPAGAEAVLGNGRRVLMYRRRP